MAYLPSGLLPQWNHCVLAAWRSRENKQAVPVTSQTKAFISPRRKQAPEVKLLENCGLSYSQSLGASGRIDLEPTSSSTVYVLWAMGKVVNIFDSVSSVVLREKIC